MKNTTTVIIIVLAAVLVLFLLGVVGMVGFGGFGRMGNMMSGYGFGYNPLHAILSLVSWALIIAGVVLLVVWFVRNANKGTSESSQSPLEILKARYAKGEISKDQFEEMKREVG